MKTKFKTAWDRGTSEVSEVGNPIQTTYKYVIDADTGRKKWVANGTSNLYDKIQKSLEGVKLENIIKKVSMGEEALLNAVSGDWVDVTEMPQNLIDAQNMILDCKRQFENLPLEIRKKFDNDVEYYVSMYGSQMWADAMGYNTPKEVAKAVETMKGETVENEG